MSRLSCQVEVNDTPLVVEIPRYTINMVKRRAKKMKWTDTLDIAIQLRNAIRMSIRSAQFRRPDALGHGFAGFYRK
jgi:hypothetical protein